MSILSVRNISKSFAGHKVLDNINFELEKGEFFSVVGPSGCGKTTLLRIIAGLEFPDSGEIFIDGKNHTNEIAQKRNVGIVFQNYALFPNMSVFENIAYGLEVRKLSREIIKSKVYSVLEKVMLTDKAEKNVTSLSGGEQQRVSLARVIVTEPSLMLFDEPLSNLDYALRIETRNEIKRLQKEAGITSVYVTHDQSEALALSDRVAVLNKGIIQQTGNPFEIYYNPGNIFVAEFIGHSNLFDKSFAKILFNIDIDENEMLSVFQEELQPEVCNENCKAVITGIQFTGFAVEYILKFKDKLIKCMMPAQFQKHKFNAGDNVNLKLNTDKVRVIKIN